MEFGASALYILPAAKAENYIMALQEWCMESAVPTPATRKLLKSVQYRFAAKDYTKKIKAYRSDRL